MNHLVLQVHVCLSQICSRFFKNRQLRVDFTTIVLFIIERIVAGVIESAHMIYLLCQENPRIIYSLNNIFRLKTFIFVDI